MSDFVLNQSKGGKKLEECVNVTVFDTKYCIDFNCQVFRYLNNNESYTIIYKSLKAMLFLE